MTSIILEKGGTFGYETLEEKDVEPPAAAEADGTDARAPTVRAALALASSDLVRGPVLRFLSSSGS